MTRRDMMLFAVMAALILGVGFIDGWNAALTILNFGLIWAVMSLGVNIQWGYAGLFNVGIVGFTALGGLAVVLTSMSPVPEAWSAGGPRVMLGLIMGALALLGAVLIWTRLKRSKMRGLIMTIWLVGSFFVYRAVFDPAVQAIEAINPASTGYLGGLGLPVLFAWVVGGILAAIAAWMIGKTALGLRSDYLAIATLGIGEIIVAVMKNEEWMTRGVKNVNGLPRPVPYEVDLQQSEGFVGMANSVGLDPVTASTLAIKLAYSGLFLVVLLGIVLLCELALKSPWGRLMRAIRDNEIAAEAMGKDVTRRHLQIFILGSAVCGIAGAMLTTLHGQLTPSSYNPLHYTFLIWVMVIVGGSGNNWGAVLGGLLIGFLWLESEQIGGAVMSVITAGMADGSAIKVHLLDSVAHMRLLMLGVVLLLVLRFSPRGLIPER
ncbi:branched-chain amino acid ABC transporter permease [Actibacterium sp. XHP0104]|uniref:branched-chain amino acid ABC transporter permease n=1 Tax=Actibacterium sp. XHP0104 TaxID=2984335 RepID=UPI0021E76DDD|nr:branched-chain amino acid ABC transporter permease [Actibacterium sp. XHP0104]MCV2881111.1 branched-chain amino acid ABC transporter permease [Actibacterium sp. XHP0104]